MTTNTYKDAAGVTAYFATIDGAGTSGDGWVNRMATHIDDAAFTAADPLVAVGGLYQTTIDEVDANDIGIARITVRRALMGAADYSHTTGAASAITGPDLEHSTSLTSSWGTALTTDFAGTFFASGVNQYFRVPMDGFRSASIAVKNTGTSQTVDLTLWIDIGALSGDSQTESIAVSSAVNNATHTFLPYDHGPGGSANIQYTPALMVPMQYLIMALNFATGPAAGSVVIAITRRT